MVGFYEATGMAESADKLEPLDVPQERRALVSQWCGRVRHAKARLEEKAFKQMREDMTYARLGSNKAWATQGNYVANIIHRHIRQVVSTLYAKNPRAEAKRRRRLDYRVWDGTPEALQQALMILQANPMDPNALELMMDVNEAQARRKMVDRIGKTLEILFDYFTGEQQPSFKKQMKQLVRRVKVCGVGYIELGFQRLMEPNPDVTSQIATVADQIAAIQRMQKEILDGDIETDSPEVEELRSAMRSLQEQEMVIVREGPLFLFPRSTEIIFDPMCRDIDGFIGARWVATEMTLSPARVKEVYGVDLGGRYTPYKTDNRDYYIDDGASDSGKDRNQLACLWRIQDKATGTVFTVCDGYADFIKPPAAPDVKLERFFTIFPLTFNDVESEGEDGDEIIPCSDVYYMRHMQDELNRARQGLREHKQANRPAYATAKGRLEDSDKANLATRPPNAIIELAALAPNEKIGDLLQTIQPAGIDPNVYDVNGVFDDILRTVGAQEANFGPVRGKNTATESAIAESSRTDVASSDVDDLDEFLSELAAGAGHLMLLELDRQTVEQIAGPGAVWPELSRDEIVRDLELTVRAGSSGKPNRAAELANLERGMPFIIQLPSMNPAPFGRKYLDLLDIDVEDAITEGLPSIVAMNAAAGRQVQPGTGDQNDPQQQGGAGGDNSSREPEQEPGGQPQFPTSPEDHYMLR